MTYIVISNDSFRRYYETLDEVINAHWMDFICNYNVRVLDYYDHQVVDPEYINSLIELEKQRIYKRNIKRRLGKYEFRKGPVPNISRKRYSFSYFRHPKTFQELKEYSYNYFDEDIKDYKIKIRKKRKNIPNYWDEIIRSDYKHFSWKRNRKTQWRST